MCGGPPWSSGSVLDHRSLPPVFESRREYFWRLFRLSLRLVTFGGSSAHLAYLVHKSGRKTSIIIIIIICLKEANLKLNVSKCTFAQTKIRFLGHVVSGEGIQVDPNKIRVVKEYPIPTNLKRLRGFLGLCFYYGSFVKDFSKIVRPLNKLQQNDAPFTLECRVSSRLWHFETSLNIPVVVSVPQFRSTVLCLYGRLYWWLGRHSDQDP